MAEYWWTEFKDEDGVPYTGLTGARISIYRIDTDALVVDNQLMSEVGLGVYKYSQAGYDIDLPYVGRCDGGVPVPDAYRYTFGDNRDDLQMSGKIPVNNFADQTLIDADFATIEGKIDLIQADTTQILIDISDLDLNTVKLLAMNRLNTVIENTFDALNRHTGFIQYCYDSPANKILNDHVTGLLYSFQLDVTYNGVTGNPDEVGLEEL